jgi:D-alanyl-D-alanine carboxypeptidase/D-alanyl-D-alanine-endopeptidase (penicillin-binding protein 4)
VLLLALVQIAVAPVLDARRHGHRRARTAAAGEVPLLGGSLAERLAALAKHPPVAGSQFAVAVAKVGEREPLLAVNATTPLTLASTTKLFTTAAALDRLGKSYTFKTRVFRDAEVGADGVLPGHIVVMGGGDPALSGRLYDDDPLAVFRPWAGALSAAGVRKIRDGLLLDVSFFDDVRVHPDWPPAQEQSWWQAPVSALSYNDNVVLVRATGGFRPGAPALLGFYPAGPPLLSIIGRVLTTTGHRGQLGVRRPTGSHTVLAAGRVGSNRTWSADVTVPDPPLYLAAALTSVLREAGIEVGAQPSLQTVPLKAPPLATGRTLLYTHETPILPVLAVCNKRSQSLYAEHILKTLGAEKRGLGTWTNGTLEVKEFLASFGLDTARYALVDGSGRSPNNKTSADDYLAFLQALATRWDKFDAFEPTLAISGDQEGSLRHRFLGPATRGKVYAKTGYIQGVVSLCGYVHARSGQKYAFAILINGGCPEWKGHVWQDRFVSELAERG